MRWSSALHSCGGRGYAQVEFSVSICLKERPGRWSERPEGLALTVTRPAGRS